MGLFKRLVIALEIIAKNSETLAKRSFELEEIKRMYMSVNKEAFLDMEKNCHKLLIAKNKVGAKMSADEIEKLAVLNELYPEI